MAIWRRNLAGARSMPRWIALLLAASSALIAASPTPAVIAHRGGASSRPENTIAAFEHAIRLGVPVLEFDMNMTADGEIILHHDSAVNPKICKAVPGSTVQPGPIGLLTVAQLRQFDCGSFEVPNSPRFRPAPGAKMPTLDEFLAAVKGSNAIVLGETKMPPQGASYAPDPEKFVAKIYASIQKHQMERRFILQPADYRTLTAMSKKHPAIQICPLSARRYKPDYLAVAKKNRATHLMLRFDDAPPEEFRKLRAAGIKIFSGTANTGAEWQKYVELNFDGILTDDPEGLIEFLGARK